MACRPHFLSAFVLGFGMLLTSGACSPATDDVPNAAVNGSNSASATRSKQTAADSEKAVRNTFDKFLTAIRAKKGPEAREAVSSDTLKQYERARVLALDSSGADFESLDQMTVALIFQMRYLSDRAKLETMTGASVFEWGVEEGMTQPENFAGMAIARVHIDGDKAFATISKDGVTDNECHFEFVREEDDWKWDIAAFMRQIDKPLATLRQGRTKTEFALFLLERTYEKPIPKSILDGPLK